MAPDEIDELKKHATTCAALLAKTSGALVGVAVPSQLADIAAVTAYLRTLGVDRENPIPEFPTAS